MPNIIDMTGKVLFNLTVLGPSRKKNGTFAWNCLCICGKETVVDGSQLRTGGTKSCGCTRYEQAVKHGQYKSLTYKVWNSMIQRCTNPNMNNYKRYGGRGITVCERWLSFDNFYEDMGDKPSGASIERIDNNKGYYPNNCRWATRLEQARNREPYSTSRTGVSGVGFHKQTNKWRVRITVKGKSITIGSFSTIEQAIEARKRAEQEYWTP